MPDEAFALLAAVPFLLVVSSLIPIPTQRATWMSRLAAVHAILSFAFLLGWAGGWVPAFEFRWSLPGTSIGGLFHYNGPASLMLALVAFIGWVISRYSVRYLDGESGRNRYFRWLSATVGFVSLLVLSGDLLTFWAFWVLTSVGLHHLLTHYGDRPLAARGAWTKFTVSRLGDALLLASIAILWRQTGSLEFEALNSLGEGSASTPMVAAITMLVVGTVMKTAQVPFHTWLPLTLETPTPVSALMHAGIVNAGGYLMIQCSGLLMLAPSAMTTLVVFGALTACYGSTVMITQTSVKNALAYSTIAQMGFMILQCGLGAFSAAMLHIVAHSLYKAYAFLSSGSVMERRKAMLVPTRPTRSLPWLGWLASVICLAAVLGATGTLFSVNLETKAGGIVLGSVLLAALATWLADVFRQDDPSLLTRSLLTSAALCVIYVVSLAGVSYLISTSITAEMLTGSSLVSWAMAAVILSLAVGFQWLRERDSFLSPRWSAMQIHAANGFYIDQCLRRLSRTV